MSIYSHGNIISIALISCSQKSVKKDFRLPGGIPRFQNFQGLSNRRGRLILSNKRTKRLVINVGFHPTKNKGKA